MGACLIKLYPKTPYTENEFEKLESADEYDAPEYLIETESKSMMIRKENADNYIINAEKQMYHS